ERRSASAQLCETISAQTNSGSDSGCSGSIEGIFHRNKGGYHEWMSRVLLLLLALTVWPMAAADQILLVVLKGTGAVGYYSLDGKLLTTVKVGEHPHEIAISPDGKFAYVTDNGTMRMEDAGKGGNTVSIIDIAARKRVGTISTGTYRRPHGISVDSRTG